MIIEKSAEGADEAWMVHPCPGYVLKFKEVNLGSDVLPEQETHKLFLNVCHCEQLPAPMVDLEEDQVAEILDSDDPSRYKIPLCVGDVECVRDNKDDNSAKIDVVVNSTFFKKRLETSEFFRQLFLLVASEAIQGRHDIKIVPKDAIQLKNRKVMGEISAQRIRKKPEQSIIEEVGNESDDSESETDEEDEKDDGTTASSENCLVLLHPGPPYPVLEVTLKLPESYKTAEDAKKVHVKGNSERLIIHDHQETFLDIYTPFQMLIPQADTKLFVQEKTLQFFVPIVP